VPVFPLFGCVEEEARIASVPTILEVEVLITGFY